MNRKLYAAVILFLCLLLLLPAASWANGDEQTESVTIKLAALLPMTGELASKGEIRKYAIERGVEDVNTRWQEEAVDLQFELIVEDSESNPEVALTKAEQLRKEGVELFIAGSSAEMEKLQPWAEEHRTVVISYSSTSPALGIEGDGVFRMVPDDTQQAKALAALLEFEGIYGIVPVYRNDIYGRELTESLTKEFTQLHGTVADPVTYEPETTEWDHIMTQITDAVNNLDMEQERIAVVLFAFDEAAELLARLDEADRAGEVRWFGSDTVTLSPVILKEEHIAEQAAKVHLTGITFGVPESALLHSIQSELHTFAEGAFLPDALFAYDIPGMLASIIENLSEPYQSEILIDQMITGSESYAGVTGWTLLDHKGDRKYYHYDVWEVRTEDEDTYVWQPAAKYLSNPGMPGYIVPNTPANEEPSQAQTDSFLFGYEGQSFEPERMLTRAEFTYMIINALGQLPTDGIEQEAAFADDSHIDPRAREAVAAAEQLGIVSGYEDQTFRPNQDITWIEAIVMSTLAMQWELDGLLDTELLVNVPDWAKKYVQTALNHHLIVAAEDFESMLSGPLTLSDAMLLIIEMMKGSEEL